MPLFDKQPQDPRVLATRTICRASVAMMALSVPIAIALKDLVLPFVVLGVAGVGLASVWFFGRSKVVAMHSKEIDALEKSVGELTERLGDVEVRNRFEEVLAEKELDEVTGARSMGTVSEQ